MASPHGYNQDGIALLYQVLAARGIPPSVIPGAISGIMGESGANLDPTSFNTKDPGGGSGGIGQWNRDRLVGPTGMLAFAQNAGVPGLDINTPTDSKKVPLATQIQYLGHELDTRYAGVTSQLKNATTPQQALNIWVNDYENPADKAGAIKQRSGYLGPVSAALGQPGGTTVSSPTAGTVASGATPGYGTSLSSTPAAPKSWLAQHFPGLETEQGQQQFEQKAKELEKDITGKGGDQKQSDVQPFQLTPMTSNVPGRQGIEAQAAQIMPAVTGYQPTGYGTLLNSPGLQVGSAPPSPPAWAQGQGLQQQAPGTSLNSLIAYAQGYPYASQFLQGFGGYYGQQ